jgi:hypothetical protein
MTNCNLNVELNVEKLWETENYIPDQIRKAMSLSIENRKLWELPKPKNRSYLTEKSKNRPKNWPNPQKPKIPMPPNISSILTIRELTVARVRKREKMSNCR